MVMAECRLLNIVWIINIAVYQTFTVMVASQALLLGYQSHVHACVLSMKSYAFLVKACPAQMIFITTSLFMRPQLQTKSSYP